MKKTLKGYLVGVLSTALLFGCIGYASSTTKTIDVFYDNIKIVVDGEEIDARDANNQKVEPFIYDGTTYLPVRAIGNAIGKEVSWDGVEKVVYLGAQPNEAENWLSVCKPYRYSNGKEYYYSKNEYFTMAGEKYTNGYVLKESNWDGGTEALYNLNGKFKNLSFKVGVIDGYDNTRDATLNIYLDGIIAYTTTIKYDDVPRTISIPLNNALKMKIEVDVSSGAFNSAYGFSEGNFE